MAGQNPTAGLPDIQSLLGSILGQVQPNFLETERQMGAMQDFIRTQQNDRSNIPALQFAAGLLKPTKTGSFAESVGEASEGALGALQKQREIDLDRQSKILALTQAKGQLLATQANMLMPFAQMQALGSAADSAFGGGAPAGTPGGGADAGGAPAAGAGAAEGVPDPLARYRSLIKVGMTYKNPEALTAAKLMVENDPSLKAAIAGAESGAKAAAEAPYQLVEVTLPDGSKAQVPKSTFTGGGARAGINVPSGSAAAAPGAPKPAAAAGAPGAGGQVAPPASAGVENEVAGELYKEAPKQLEMLETQRQRAEAAAKVLEKLETGKWTDVKSDVVAGMRSIFGQDAVKNLDTANPQAAEVLLKNGMNGIFDQVKLIGGQVRVAELDGLEKGMYRSTAQPGTNKEILAQLLGASDWKRDMLKDYSQAYESGEKVKPASWMQNWTEQHSLGDYVTKRLEKLPIKGVAPAEVPIGGMGVASRDISPTLSKGERYIRVDENKFVPLDQYADYLRAQGQQ